MAHKRFFRLDFKWKTLLVHQFQPRRSNLRRECCKRANFSSTKACQSKKSNGIVKNAFKLKFPLLFWLLYSSEKLKIAKIGIKKLQGQWKKAKFTRKSAERGGKR